MAWTLFLALLAPTATGDGHDRFYRAFYMDLAEGKTEQALAEYRELLTAFADDADHRAWVRVRVAACELKLGRKAEALKALADAASVEGIGESVRNALADVRGQLGGSPAVAKSDPPAKREMTPTRKAVEAGLRYLLQQQRVDGHWPSQREVQGKPVGLRGLETGMTALVLSTMHESGAFTRSDEETTRALDRAVVWLISKQDAQGRIGFSRGCEEWIYNHGLATHALAEIYATTRKPDLREPVSRAVSYILKHQNKHFGWKYEESGGLSDTSVTATMTYALLVAHRLAVDKRIDVEPGKIAQSIGWAQNWTNRATAFTNGRTGYEAPGDAGSRLRLLRDKNQFRSLPTMTAAGIFVRFAAGEDRQTRSMQQGTALLMEEPHLPSYTPPEETDPGKINFVYWHWGTRAMRLVGGPSWDKWKAELLRALLPHQEADGHWTPAGYWSPVGGRILSTALAVSTLIEAER